MRKRLTKTAQSVTVMRSQEQGQPRAIYKLQKDLLNSPLTVLDITQNATLISAKHHHKIITVAMRHPIPVETDYDASSVASTNTNNSIFTVPPNQVPNI